MKLCMELNIPFIVPSFIMQDASHAEANAAVSVFGPTVKILMCWYHLVYNVKKHKSLDKVNKEVADMVLVDLTRLHYCLIHEFEPFKKIVLDKWKSMPDLADFVAYVVPQWFEGTFTNWQIFKSPPGFANTNNPLESFNKMIKAQFTNYDAQPILGFIYIVMNHLIPYYSINFKEFMFYRIPHKKTIKIAKSMNVQKFKMNSVVQCSYTGSTYTHTINFRYKSCTCRWFMAFTVCSHLVSACDLFEQELSGYTKKKTFVIRAKRGAKKAPLTFTERAFASNPMPIIAVPVSAPIVDERQSLFLIDSPSVPGNPSVNPSLLEEIVITVKKIVPVPEIPTQAKAKRVYVKKVPAIEPRQSKRLQRDPVPVALHAQVSPKKRGRPRKTAKALSVE